MKELKLILIPEDLDMEANYSLAFAFGSLVVLAFLVFILASLSVKPEIIIGIFVVFFPVSMIIRKNLSDLTAAKKLKIGDLILKDDAFVLKKDREQIIELNSVSELVYFHSAFYSTEHYSNQEFQKTGNALIFVQFKNGNSQRVKFNIPDEKSYTQLLAYIEHSKSQVEYVKDYPITELNHILNDEKTARRKFR
jgi:hypothetical protein